MRRKTGWLLADRVSEEEGVVKMLGCRVGGREVAAGTDEIHRADTSRASERAGGVLI